MKISHLDLKTGQVKMVNVGEKKETQRFARAGCEIKISPELFQFLNKEDRHRENLFTTCRLAGIQGAKKTAELIPMCHSLGLDQVGVELKMGEKNNVILESAATLIAKTGVEMEAIVAVSLAALTFYDMVKSEDKSLIVGGIKLLEKSGGKSGHFRHPSIAGNIKES